MKITGEDILDGLEALNELSKHDVPKYEKEIHHNLEELLRCFKILSANHKAIQEKYPHEIDAYKRYNALREEFKKEYEANIITVPVEEFDPYLESVGGIPGLAYWLPMIELVEPDDQVPQKYWKD